MQTRIRTLVASAVLLGAHAAPAAHAASVNGVGITDEQVSQAMQQARLPDTPQARNVVRQQLIAQELFSQQAAEDKSLEARADVQHALRQARAQILTQAWLKDRIKPEPVTEAQVRERYDAIVSTLGEKEYKARLIEVADGVAAAAALARIKGGEDFGKVARDVSLAPSKASGGAMEWISFRLPAQEGRTRNVPLPIAEAIATLPAGAVSGAPVVWNQHSFVIKVDEVRPTQVPAYDEARPGIEHLLQVQALERATAALVVQLLGNAKIVQ